MDLLKVLSIFFSVLFYAVVCENLICEHDGVFIHPTDCKSLYTCRGTKELGFISTVHRCPYGYSVDKATRRCVDSSLVKDCITSRENDPLCENELIHCTNCSHIVSCSNIGGEYVDPVITDCGYNTNNEPLYCDNNLKLCTDVLPDGCNVPDFVCTSTGLFPDPLKCDIYHICYDTFNYESNRCNNSLFYVSKYFQCNTTSTCKKAECDTVGVQAYVPDNRYFVFCGSSGLELYKCPGNTRYEGSNCIFTCEIQGLFVDMTDCRNYRRCTPNSSGSFDQTIETCPTGLAFNPNSLSCEDQNIVRCPPS